MKLLLKYGKTNLVITIFVGIVSTVAWVYFAKIMEYTVNITENGEVDELLRMVTISVIYIFLVRLLFYIYEILKIRSTNQFGEALRTDLISSAFESKKINDSGEKMSMINNDVKVIQENYYVTFVQILTSIVSFVLSSYLLFIISWEIMIVLYVITLTVIAIPYIFKKMLRDKNQKYVMQLSLMNSRLKDFLGGFNVIKNFNAEIQVRNRIVSDFKNIKEAKIKFDNTNQTVVSVSHFFVTLIGIIGFLMGSYYVVEGRFFYGSMIAIVQLTNTLVTPVNIIVNNISRYISSKKIIQNVEKNLCNVENNEHIDDNGDCFTVDKIIIKHLTVQLNNKNILNDISYQFDKGKKYLILGKTGAGKSTLLNVIVNQLDSIDGYIKYICDGQEMKYQQIDKQITMVEQNPWIFNMSIEENIVFYREQNLERVRYLIEKMLFSENFIKCRKDEVMSENAISLSQGEKKRISIARAIYSSPSFLLLDEINSSTDVKTGLKIEKDILNIKNIGIINVAHHINKGLIEKYDYIIELVDGKIVDKTVLMKDLIKNNIQT